MLFIKGVKCVQQAKMRNLIQDPSTTFNAYCAAGKTEWWVDTEFSRGMITEIDRIDVRDTSRTTREILLQEGVRLQDIATGTKNVILCKYFDTPDKVYNRMGFMGENCFKWLLQAAIEKDIYMSTTVYREFPENDTYPAGALVFFEDIGYTAHNAREWIRGMLDVGITGVFEA